MQLTNVCLQVWQTMLVESVNNVRLAPQPSSCLLGRRLVRLQLALGVATCTFGIPLALLCCLCSLVIRPSSPAHRWYQVVLLTLPICRQ